MLAQLAEDFGGFAELLGENVARAVERGFGVSDAFFRIDELCGFGLRIERGIGEQRLRERFEAGLAGDLRPRAALRAPACCPRLRWPRAVRP
jgi:hypothetical protein